jgi:hypothetical protein
MITVLYCSYSVVWIRVSGMFRVYDLNALQFHGTMAYCSVRMHKFRPHLRDPFWVWGVVRPLRFGSVQIQITEQ